MQALHRELLEELGVALTGVRQIGQVTGEGIEDGNPLEVHLYSAEVIGTPRPQAPIVELEWLGRSEAVKRQDELTSIAREEILPFLDDAKLW
jgi:8-oxo-dGTP pyrophosphatase MutT (NUDIX family)